MERTHFFEKIKKKSRVSSERKKTSGAYAAAARVAEGLVARVGRRRGSAQRGAERSGGLVTGRPREALAQRQCARAPAPDVRKYLDVRFGIDSQLHGVRLQYLTLGLLRFQTHSSAVT